MAGGGTGQFAAIPLNLIKKTGKAAYITTGTWSSKAAKEARKYGQIQEIKADVTAPLMLDWGFWQDLSYVYYCANETVHGIEFPVIPETNEIPLVADMSSNFLTRDIDVSKVN